MNNRLFWLGLIMLIISCGKQISSAIASSPSNTTTAPWRITRTTIASNASLADKDSLCINEFGSDFITGTDVEVIGYMNYALPVVTTGNNPISSFDTAGNRGYSYGNAETVGRLFCIHK